MVVVVMLVRKGFLRRAQAVFVHDLADLHTAELVPGRGDEPGLRVEPFEKLDGGQGLLLVCAVRAAEDDQVGVLHLVVEKLAEVAHVHLALAGVHDRDLRADLRALDALHGLRHVGELADAGGLDEDAVGREVGHDLAERLREVAHQGAADAAGIHLRDLHARVLQETAVDGDLAELVLNEHQLLAAVALGDQLADQRGFAGAEKAGKYINSCHNDASFSFLNK